MTIFENALFGLALVMIGAVKTVAHLSALPFISVPTCGGAEVILELGSDSFFTRLHCWGCYMVCAGLLVLSFAVWRACRARHFVTPNVH